MADPTKPLKPIKPPKEETGPSDAPKPPKANTKIKNKVEDTFDDDVWMEIVALLKPLKKKDPPYTLDDYAQAIDKAGYGAMEVQFLFMTLQMVDERVPHDEPRVLYPTL